MSRDYKLYLEDMAAAAQFIETHTHDLSFEKFTADEMRLRAVLQSLTEIGEAAKHIPDDVRQLAPNIPWREIAGTRDIIVHGYFAVNLTIIWDIVEREIPGLRARVRALLDDLDA
jgi:uncharacterized protein with HEPN domain